MVDRRMGGSLSPSFAVWLQACGGGGGPADQEAVNEKQIRAVLEIWDSRDFSQIDSIFAEDGVFEDAAEQSVHRGREAIKQLLREVESWAPDTRIEARSFFVAGNRGAAEWIWSGTQTGEIPGLMPATGKPFSIHGVTLFEFENGMIRRSTDYYNAASFLQQLGAELELPTAG